MDLMVFGDRVLLGVVFAVAAVTKLAGRGSFDAFVSSVRSVPFITRNRARPLAVVVVGLELVGAALLTTAATTRAGFLLLAGLGAALTVVVVAQVAAGVRTPCRCFGPSRIPVGRRHAVRNGGLTALAAAGWVAAPWADGQPPPAMLAVVAAAGLVGAIVVIVSDEVVDLFTDPARPATPPTR